MASQTALKGLRRLWKSIPLSTLNQGSSLSIRSEVPLASLNIVSQWRDDGHIDFQQILGPVGKGEQEQEQDHHRDHDDSLDLTITQLDDRMTSLGRSASHLSLALQRTPKASASAFADTGKSGDTYSLTSPNNSENDENNVDDEVIFEDGTTHATKDEGITEPGVHLTVMVPEKLNLDVKLDYKGDICVPGKIEGDVELATSDGAIKVKKLRGHKIALESFGQDALIHASDLVEAQTLTMKTSGRVRAKQLHGSSIDVRVAHSENSQIEFDALDTDDDVALIDISSIYVAGEGGALLSVQSAHPQKKAIRLKTNHGPIRASVNGVCQPTTIDPNTNEIQPLIELGGVNGNFELFTENTVVRHDNTDWNSSLVHVDSLSPDTVSLLTADAGDVSVTVDRKVETDIRLLSTLSKECLEESSALLAEEEDGDLALSVIRNMPISPGESLGSFREPSISIETKAFTERPGGVYKSEHIHYIDGWVDNNSAEPPSRFDRKVRGETALGKINIDSAADQALNAFGEKTEDAEEFPRPLMAVIGTGNISLETVSWLGAIARRYGLDEGGRDLGRTASRKGRPIQPLPTSE